MPQVRPPSIRFDETIPVFRPADSSEGYWIGAPSVHSDGSDTYLAIRERNPRERGHTLGIYRRESSNEYGLVVEIEADDLGVESIERSALLTDPKTGAWKLYLSVDHDENDWRIHKLDDVSMPAAFDSTTAREVLGPQPGRSDGKMVKDPYVLFHDDRYYMYYAGSDGRSEQAHLATSSDGENWNRAGTNPVLSRQHWHDHHTRITCVVPTPDDPGWLLYYDGSGTTDYRNSWNLRTGVAFSQDLMTVVDTSPRGPVYSTKDDEGRSAADRYATFRYMDILPDGDRWTVYFEAARDDAAFELRQATVTLDG